MTEAKRYWITEQGMKEAAKEIADFQRKGEERGLVLRAHIIARMIAAHSEIELCEAAAPPQGTPAPEPEKCPECGSDDPKVRFTARFGAMDIQCANPWHSTVAAQKEKP